MPFKDLCKVTLVGKDHFQSNLREREIRFLQKTLGDFKPFTEHKLMEAFASGPAKETCKMIIAKTDLLRKHTQREGALKMGKRE